MEQMINVKTEDSGEILLYYVEDNGDGEGVTAIESIDASQLELPEGYVLQDATEADFQMNVQHQIKQEWSDSEIHKLLVFYSDNREHFSSTNNQHLWTVACKTMLGGRDPESCAEKLEYLMNKYIQCCLNGVDQYWTVFDICHQVFHNDDTVIQMIQESQPNEESEVEVPKEIAVKAETKTVHKSNTDPMVLKMLQLYLKQKKSKILTWQKGLWEKISREMGDNDADYWHKKFMNFKQHYIRMLDKRRETGNNSVTWPYMEWFDKIYDGDVDFKNKYVLGINQQKINTFTVHSGPQKIKTYTLPPVPEPVVTYNQWDTTKVTVLVKYYFDCFDEFEDPKIPNMFLWTEVGRLLEQDPKDCLKKYEELKSEHYERYSGEYDLNTREPLAILFDNIISKEVQLEIQRKENVHLNTWKLENVNELVTFIFNKVDVFKDPICYFVCFAVLAMKLDRSIPAIKAQWDTLKALYNSILVNKMENPDDPVDWRYFEQFDRIFDYGTDSKLLQGFELQFQNKTTPTKVISNLNSSTEPQENGTTKDLPFDKVFTRGRAIDKKAIQLLEYYIKNKDKFNSSAYKKTDLWSPLAKKVGMTATQCSHRFRNLKQVFTSYVQREVSHPEKPITWPYYDLCKKAFGYRATKSKVKLTEDYDKWTAKEIKQLLDFVSIKFVEIICNSNDSGLWTPLVQEIGRTEKDCSDKFAELKRSYHKLKAIKEKDPNFKINWKYYNTIDDIYTSMKGNVLVESMEVIEGGHDDDYQCIIVLPEGEEMTDFTNATIVKEESEQNDIQQSTQTTHTESKTKWNKFSKKKLLKRYLSYIRLHKGIVINAKEMWQEIAAKINKPVFSCRKMFLKLKQNHIEATKDTDDVNRKTPYYALMYKIIALKPKFAKTGQKSLGESKVYNDVTMDVETVHKALQYYSQHIKDFVSPRYEKKYLWTELAQHVSEPVTKVFNKINYLKQTFKNGVSSNEVVSFSDILKHIIAKENEYKNNTAVKVEYQDDQWNDDDIEQLLIWYLANLENFKNPKFVRSYLWMEISNVLKKSPLNCSKKMSEVRTQYRNMVREDSTELAGWKFFELCQKIYGTGKKGSLTFNS